MVLQRNFGVQLQHWAENVIRLLTASLLAMVIGDSSHWKISRKLSTGKTTSSYKEYWMHLSSRSPFFKHCGAVLSIEKTPASWQNFSLLKCGIACDQFTCSGRNDAANSSCSWHLEGWNYICSCTCSEFTRCRSIMEHLQMNIVKCIVIVRTQKTQRCKRRSCFTKANIKNIKSVEWHKK